MKTTRLLWFVITCCCISCTQTKQAQTTAATAECALLSTALSPKFPPEYYAEQGKKYFLTMQSDVSLSVQPNYSDLVIRWEWPPWLLLTGFGKSALIVTGAGLKLNPTAYSLLDCRYFDTQPFCRCHVVFDYGGTLCPIYEEFTFNDRGEITFIEAWSDYESLLPMTKGDDNRWDEQEYWGMKNVNRLSTKVPGLGKPDGRIDPTAPCMKQAAQTDKDLAELLSRLDDPLNTWLKQTITHRKELENGCNPPQGDVYPYYR